MPLKRRTLWRVTLVAGLIAVTPASAKKSRPSLPSRRDFAGRSCHRGETDKMTCMVCNIYFEARGERHPGKVAVGRTTLTRITRKEYPDSICGVVWQPGQFSWTSGGSARLPNRNARDYITLVESVTAAKEVFRRGPNGLANFCNPKKSGCPWRKTPKCVATQRKIGRHLFCDAGPATM